MEYVIRFEPVGTSIRVEEGTSLLEATLQAGLPLASACGAEGACSRCGVKVLAGTESLPNESQRESIIKSRNRVNPELRLACKIRIDCDLVITTPYW